MTRQIQILGAGVVGLWQALGFARRGFAVTLYETTSEPFADAASRYAGTMLSPDCEFPAVQKNARQIARRGLQLWQKDFSAIKTRGSLVVARDPAELEDLALQSEHYTWLSRAEIADLEPDLALRFTRGLHFEHEAHAATDQLLNELLGKVRDAGVAVVFGQSTPMEGPRAPDAWLIDCRGISARDVLPDLRGVRGERLILKAPAISFARPVRFLDLRQPIYMVPWPDNQFMLGATLIESEDSSDVTVKSALDLMSRAYDLHPAFGEAEIIEIGAGVRPALPDNLPAILVHENDRRISVNGVYRHGFLLAPVLADATADFLTDQRTHPWLRHHDTLHSPRKVR